MRVVTVHDGSEKIGRGANQARVGSAFFPCWMRIGEAMLIDVRLAESLRNINLASSAEDKSTGAIAILALDPRPSGMCDPS